jgi:prepilin-type N-terminal cleavage/methylation domain-containing protein
VSSLDLHSLISDRGAYLGAINEFEMAEYFQSNSHQSGVSLVELLVVIVVISIIAAFALMQRGSTDAQLTRQNAARELKTAFERARFDSVKRRADGTVPYATVLVEAAQITLTTDVNQDGDMDGTDLLVTRFPPNITVTPRSGSLPITVSFDRRGEPDIADPTFVVCNGTCNFDNDTAANANVIHVTPTGTVSMLPGGSNPAAFPTPAVQTVPGGTSIRIDTYVSPTP